MKTVTIAPSLLSADFSEFGRAAELVEASGAPWVHLDVMDGRFVPAITFGPKLVKDLRKRSKLVLDAHLMIEEPERQLDAFVDAGADYLTFHLEACVHAHRLAGDIRKRGVKAGVSIVPSTPVSLLSELLGDVDLVLVMSVNPGAGGQKLIPGCLEKIRQLAALRAAGKGSYLISVDGGVNAETAGLAIDAGADVLVMGSAFFEAADPAALVASVAQRGRAC